MPYEESVTCRDPLENNLWTFNAKEGLCQMIPNPACANQLNTFASADQCAEFCIGKFAILFYREEKIFSGKKHLFFPVKGLNEKESKSFNFPYLLCRGKHCKDFFLWLY